MIKHFTPMKNIFTVIIASFIGSAAMAIVPAKSISSSQNHLHAKNALIDALDTVVFNLAKAAIAGNSISFPVSILSDDTVNALDFSFKYVHSKLRYDSISDLTNYLQPLAFYNPNDSTVRFTSNSFQRYGNDTALVKVHFTLLSGQFDAADLTKVKAYLNGNVCSVKVPGLLSTVVPIVPKNQDKISIYPNPSKDNFQVAGLEALGGSELTILNELGETIFKTLVKQQTININRETLNSKSGIYFLKVQSINFFEIQKIVLTN